jgi:hypothetical protein
VFVKSWRTWLLLLMVLLLPLRGAVAAAILCPVAGSGSQVELAVVGHSAAHAAMDEVLSHHDSKDHPAGHSHADAHPHAPGVAAASGDDHSSHDHGASEGCNACSAYCSLTPLLSNLPTLAEPLDPSAVKFSDLSAPPPNFVSDGQERPPRTT